MFHRYLNQLQAFPSSSSSWFFINIVGYSITICSWERTNSTTYGDGEALNTYYEIH
ncbi:hypothetical protein [Oceanobacillus alkalisoli]|uniref:hypothetical protein n=1 Tax=Oceanobacillus alkalisoli TaxID=2925113 RepID=UPI001F120A22|nr:hypothetical protein [Oceanobacillus alkalisoli]MCF3944156.1 hypothetical protein [Oceanobacillus alkalisoli]